MQRGMAQVRQGRCAGSFYPLLAVQNKFSCDKAMFLWLWHCPLNSGMLLIQFVETPKGVLNNALGVFLSALHKNSIGDPFRTV